MRRAHADAGDHVEGRPDHEAHPHPVAEIVGAASRVSASRMPLASASPHGRVVP
jgi:hypothetical protein